ncbi:uncharacterized protein LOC21409577 [Morus notabilis]|uniref:uncharacterized protein LOC21409577 n=1 Tax=Morus notabilis TaxID=981085 RepID=UPI000CED02A6|nr:uncharacterized protein LOC21409577 [Morus notabilis]
MISFPFFLIIVLVLMVWNLDLFLSSQEEIESLREIAEKLKRENSKLKNKILQISEECQEVGEENDSLMDEVEGRYGADAISDIRARNPASANQESHGDGERTLSDNNSTDDRNGEMDQ